MDVFLEPAVVVLPAFAQGDNAGETSEVAPWLERYEFESTEVAGLAQPLYYADDVVLAPTGIGKAPTATTVATLAAGDTVSLADATMVTVGIAGAPPAAGTIGSVFVADTVVDWDPKMRLDDEFELPRWNAEYVWDLDPALVERAAAAARTVELADSDRARAIRERYGDDRSPTVGMGPTIGSDELYHGRKITAEVERLCEMYGLDGFATTEMESAATAVALERFGLLDQYISVRGVSNFDREPPGGDPVESIDGLAFDLGVENAVTAGRAVVDAFRDA